MVPMWRSAGYGVGLVACALSMFPAAAAPVQGIEVIEVVERTSGTRDRMEGVITYPLAVLNAAGWEKVRVERAIHEVEAIFAQCGILVTAGSVYWLETSSQFLDLHESMQGRLLSRLPSMRPIALLVDQTADNDVAYSYLNSAPVASRGTAWVTRNSHPACLGILLAHELGHVLLNTTRHSDDGDNLMSHTCTVSNVAEFRPDASLAESQCEKLRAW